MWPFKNKCFFCRNEDDLSSVKGVDIYDSSIYYYHLECVYQVLSNPEKHIKYVDRAILIQDCIKTRKKWRSDLIKTCKTIKEELCK